MKTKNLFWPAALLAIVALGFILPIWAASTDDNSARHTRVAVVNTSGDRISPAAAGEAASAAATVVAAIPTPPTAAAVAAAVANPDSLTFTRVKIDQTAAAGQTVLIAADGTKVMRLHRLYVRMAAAGDLTIETAAGADLTGPMPVAATGIVDLKWEPAKAGSHVVTAASAGLAILTTQKVYGFAIVSSAEN